MILPQRSLLSIPLTGALIMLFSTAFSQRQFPSELWHEGRIVLLDGDTLKGTLKYDFQQNMVQYALSTKQAEAYSARKVLFFEIFDETVHKYRKFFVLPYTNASNYKSPAFFELLEEGKLTLLSRDLLEYKTYNSGFYGGSYTLLVESHSFYLLQPDGNIEDFRGNKNDLLALMGEKRRSVEKYIKSNRLDFDDKYDVAKMVAYYNSLAGT